MHIDKSLVPMLQFLHTYKKHTHIYVKKIIKNVFKSAPYPIASCAVCLRVGKTVVTIAMLFDCT